MEELDHCPLCQHNVFHHHLTCQDHTVSGEYFDIVECDRCGFRFTNPRPRPSGLGRYYEGDAYTPHQNTSESLLDTLYRWVRVYTLRSKHRLISSLVSDPPGRLLDFGCGTGEFLNLCQSRGWDASGVDPDPDAQEIAAQNYGLSVEAPSQIAEFPRNHFDAITLWHVLEHVPDLAWTIEQLRRILAPDGTLLVAVPNCASLDARYYGSHWAGYDVPRHLSHFRPNDIRRLCDRFNLTISDIRPMHLDTFYVSLLSEQYRDGWILRAPLIATLSLLWAARRRHQSSAQLYLIRQENR